jgi:ssDNA-binding Zn-finger/Zn-ribbon topoisomerase 1
MARNETAGERDVMTVECPRCGHTHKVSRAEFLDGSWMRRCPVCLDQRYDGGGRDESPNG